MNYLTLEDAQNKTMIGVLQEIKSNPKTPLDQQSVQISVNNYRANFVNFGAAYGALEQEIQESTQDEIHDSQLQNLDFLMNNMMNEFQQDYFAEDEVVQPHEAAFRVIEVDYDHERKEILGRIQILDTPAGQEAWRRIQEGMNCFVSNGGVSGAVDANNRKVGDLRPVYRVVKIISNYKLSFIKNDETFETLKQTTYKPEQ